MANKKRNACKNDYRQPVRSFENSGSVNPNESYYVPLANVTNTKKQDMKTMVDQGRYFSIFAPRQSVKTTFLELFCEELEEDPKYIAITLNFQKFKNLDKKTFYSRIQKKLYKQLTHRLTVLDCEKLDEIKSFLAGHDLTDHISFGDLFETLNDIIEFKKIVFFIDEFDGIPEDELEDFLNTIRDLYLEYKRVKQKALYSVGLVGIRNVTKLIVGGVSPFNIADQVDLPAFSLKMVENLYAQHTTETHQPFTEGAVKKVYEETEGQPWLVNRLGTILTVDIKPGTVAPIDEQDVEKAIKLFLKEKNDHFENLYEKAKLYKETFVEIVFDHVEYNPDDADQTWLEQYGLIKDRDGHAVVSNNIYKARYLKSFFKEAKAYEDISLPGYVMPGNILDMGRILIRFEQYIAQIGVNAFYKNKKPYEKTGQFLLTAWLYQFVRAGAGELPYEVNSGLGRMDILLTYKGKKYIVETKMNRGNLSSIQKEGILQVTEKYMATESVQNAYLVIFDTKTTVGEKCEPKQHRVDDKNITIVTIGIGRPD